MGGSAHSPSSGVRCRLQQGRLVRRQAAREKLRTLVAPLVTADQGSQAGAAVLGPIRPRITLSFQVGAGSPLQTACPT